MADATVLKEMNLGKIRAVLCSGCSLSKTALADITGLSFPTVGKIVDEMVKTRELQAMGMQSSSGGRCSRLYQSNPDFRTAIALILEGQTIDWFLLDSLGMTKNQGHLDVEAGLLETMALLLQTVRRSEPSLCCFVLGIAANIDGAIVQQSYEYPELKGINILKELECASGLKGAVGNDMEFSAEGSWQRLRLNDKTSLISFYLGKCGFGSSFVFNGKALKGSHNLAGEIELLPWIHQEKLTQDISANTLPESVLQCILTYALVADPDIIQLYSHPLFLQSQQEIADRLKQCYNSDKIPAVRVSDRFRMDYEIGLSRRALTMMAELKDESC